MEIIQSNKSQLSTNWVENLALEELNMDEAGIVNFNDHLDINFILEEASIHFMNQLRDAFDFYITKFNEFRGGPNSGAQIKTFKISNTVNDFMLFRNSLRLIFARKSNDLVIISLIVNGKDLYAPRASTDDINDYQSEGHEIKAHVGPFSRVSWRFQGEKVSILPMVRHYLSEFIRNSAR